MTIQLRNASPSDAPFLAKCVMAGMHFFDFESELPADEEIFRRLTGCEMREDLLYSYARTRVAEVDGTVAGSLLSYPGDTYLTLRHKTFSELWPELATMDEQSEPETDPGEYYLDTLAVLPAFRRMGIGRALLEDGIQRGIAAGYQRITLAADSEMTHLIKLYQSVGFVVADHRRAFGVDFQRMIYESDSITRTQSFSRKKPNLSSMPALK